MSPATLIFALAGLQFSILGTWSVETRADSGNPDHFRFYKDGKVAASRLDSEGYHLTVGTYKIEQSNLRLNFKYHYIDGKPSNANFQPSDTSQKLRWTSATEFRWSFGANSEAVFKRLRDSQLLDHSLRLTKGPEPVPGGLLTGTYDVQIFDPVTGMPQMADEKLPPGQRKKGIVQGKRFAVVDMMSGFQGPIRVRGKSIEFVFEEGPAGKTPKPEVATVMATMDKKILTISMRGKRVMAWTWRTAVPAISLPY